MGYTEFSVQAIGFVSVYGMNNLVWFWKPYNSWILQINSIQKVFIDWLICWLVYWLIDWVTDMYFCMQSDASSVNESLLFDIILKPIMQRWLLCLSVLQECFTKMFLVLSKLFYVIFIYFQQYVGNFLYISNTNYQSIYRHDVNYLNVDFLHSHGGCIYMTQTNPKWISQYGWVEVFCGKWKFCLFCPIKPVYFERF